MQDLLFIVVPLFTSKYITEVLKYVIITVPPLVLSGRSTRHQETHTCTRKDQTTRIKSHMDSLSRLHFLNTCINYLCKEEY